MSTERKKGRREERKKQKQKVYNFKIVNKIYEKQNKIPCNIIIKYDVCDFNQNEI